MTKLELSQHVTSINCEDLNIFLSDKQKFEQILRLLNAALSVLSPSCGRRASHLLEKITSSMRSGKEAGHIGVALCAVVVLREVIRLFDDADPRPTFLNQLHPGSDSTVKLQ